MTRPSIDYLNARRNSTRRALGGKATLVNPADLNARDNGRDSIDVAADYVCQVFADFRAFVRESDNRLAALRLSGVDLHCDDIPF